MISLQCSICNKTYLVAPYRKDKSKCCSRQCLWVLTSPDRELKRIKSVTGKKAHNNKGAGKICPRCGNYFSLPPSKLDKRKYCSSTCMHALSKKTHNIYKRITVNGHRIKEHRHVMEMHLGRKLEKDEDVHHINGNTLDNRIPNLTVLKKDEHTRLHNLNKQY